MEKKRVSRKAVETLCKPLKMRLLSHKCLGDNEKYHYYLYSLIKIDESGNYTGSIDSMQFKSLKECYNYLIEALDSE